MTERVQCILGPTLTNVNKREVTMTTGNNDAFRTRLYAIILPVALAALAWMAQLNYSSLTTQNQRIETQQAQILQQLTDMHGRIMRLEIMMYPDERPKPAKPGFEPGAPEKKRPYVYSQS